MSREAHPNIHAVGFTVDIIDSFVNRVRGQASVEFHSGDKSRVLSCLHDEIVNFVTRVSENLDKEFGT